MDQQSAIAALRLFNEKSSFRNMAEVYQVPSIDPDEKKAFTDNREALNRYLDCSLPFVFNA